MVIPGIKIDAVPCLSRLYVVSRHPSSSVSIHHSSSPATTAAHVAPSVNLSVRPWKWRLSVYTFCLLIYTVDMYKTSEDEVGKEFHTQCSVCTQEEDFEGMSAL